MKKLYAAILFLIGTSLMVNAQTAAQYYFKAKQGIALEDMSADATVILNSETDGSASPAISFFPFSFAGTTHTQFSVSEDGVVVLGNAAYTPYPYDNYFTQDPSLSGGAAAHPVLLPWAEDLYTASNGNVAYKIVGQAPARKLVIEFNVNSVEDYSSSNFSGNYNKTFQVWLMEESNTIQFVYGSMFADWYNDANIGLAASTTDYLSVNSADETASASAFFTNRTNLSNKAYVFSTSPIVDEPPVVVNPIKAAVFMWPVYPVAGQAKHTIYLGYGAQSVTLLALAGGNTFFSGYTYSWSPAAGLSSTTSPVPKASPEVTTTYTVTITDGHGNTTAKSITVNVIDPRNGKKFFVCKNGKKTITVSANAVDAQLDNGATLGACAPAVAANNELATSSSEAGRALPETTAVSKEAAVYPNPSNGAFTVRIPANMEQCLITVFDAAGRQVMQKRAGNSQQLVPVELSNARPGVYLVRIVSNGQAQTQKLIVK